jgi:hypothetical protein
MTISLTTLRVFETALVKKLIAAFLRWDYKKFFNSPYRFPFQKIYISR